MPKFITLSTALLALALVACAPVEETDYDDDAAINEKISTVRWEEIDSSFNPEIETIEFSSGDAHRLNVNLFGFRNAYVSYGRVPANTVRIEIYKVFKNRAEWGAPTSRLSNGVMTIRNGGGVYECSMRIEDSKITAVDGGCYVRINIVLPPGSALDVYNAGQLISN